jgi:hypothetical protein
VLRRRTLILASLLGKFQEVRQSRLSEYDRFSFQPCQTLHFLLFYLICPNTKLNRAWIKWLNDPSSCKVASSSDINFVNECEPPRPSATCSCLFLTTHNSVLFRPTAVGLLGLFQSAAPYFSPAITEEFVARHSPLLMSAQKRGE